MDPRRFDAIVRSFGNRFSRRAAFALAGSGLGLIHSTAESEAQGACRVVGKPCRHPDQCCTPICKKRTCRCPDGRKACGGLCCGDTEACKHGRCCTLTGEICPVDPANCCSGGCSGAHNHCCIIKGACQADVDCCFANQACRSGACCFLAGAVCGAGERCCSGVCNSAGLCA